MSNVTIFKQPNSPANTGRRELSELAKSLVQNDTTRRIQTNTNGTFKRLINGEQIGNAVPCGLSRALVLAQLSQNPRAAVKGVAQ